MKVIYLCKIEWLVPMLKDPDINLKIVHLVRDPRTTIFSRTIHSSNVTLIRLVFVSKYCKYYVVGLLKFNIISMPPAGLLMPEILSICKTNFLFREITIDLLSVKRLKQWRESEKEGKWQNSMFNHFTNYKHSHDGLNHDSETFH